MPGMKSALEINAMAYLVRLSLMIAVVALGCTQPLDRVFSASKGYSVLDLGDLLQNKIEDANGMQISTRSNAELAGKSGFGYRFNLVEVPSSCAARQASVMVEIPPGAMNVLQTELRTTQNIDAVDLQYQVMPTAVPLSSYRYVWIPRSVATCVEVKVYTLLDVNASEVNHWLKHIEVYP